MMLRIVTLLRPLTVTRTSASRQMSDYLFNTPDHAAVYSLFRPVPPRELIASILASNPSRNALVDVGCGSGQSTEPMAEHMKSVIGIDVSQAQITEANARRKNNTALKNIEYRVGSAYPLDLKNQSFDFVTCSQCVHWFDLDHFYREVKRVLKRGGIMALYGYRLPLPVTGDKKADELIEKRIMTFYRGEMGPFWELDRSLIDAAYATLEKPKKEDFVQIEENSSFIVNRPFSLDSYIQYIRSWSSYQKYIKVHPDKIDPLESIEKDLREICKNGNIDTSAIHEHTNFFLLLFKKL